MKIVAQIFLVTIFLLSGYTLLAQQITAVNYVDYARSEKDTLKVKLQLTDAQALQVEVVTSNYYLKRANLSARSESVTSRADTLTMYGQQYDAGLKAIFSDQQFVLHRQLMSDRRRIMLQKIEDDRLRNNVQH